MQLSKITKMILMTEKFLSDNNITYDEAIAILSATLNNIKQYKEQIEYDTYDDYYHNQKSIDIGSTIVQCHNLDIINSEF